MITKSFSDFYIKIGLFFSEMETPDPERRCCSTQKNHLADEMQLVKIFAVD